MLPSNPETAAAAIAGHGIAAVLHLAASIDIAESLADPLKYDRNNRRAGAALVRACVAGGVERFVFASSAAVYGLPGAAPVGEDAPARPVNPYGRFKLATERLLRRTAARHGMRYAVLRYFNVAGADPLGRAGPSGTGLPPRHGRLPGRARPARRRHRVRHRLPDTRRDLHARLHPRLRSCRHPCGGAPRPRERRAGPGAQLAARAAASRCARRSPRCGPNPASSSPSATDRAAPANRTLRAFIERQHVFFVATAAPDGSVNVSPKGMSTLRILGDTHIRWLNLSGCGNETAAHLRASNRMTLMFCAFEGNPMILRVYGQATTTHPRDAEWEEKVADFATLAGSRQIFRPETRSCPNLLWKRRADHAVREEPRCGGVGPVLRTDGPGGRHRVLET